MFFGEKRGVCVCFIIGVFSLDPFACLCTSSRQETILQKFQERLAGKEVPKEAKEVRSEAKWKRWTPSRFFSSVLDGFCKVFSGFLRFFPVFSQVFGRFSRVLL